MRKIKSHLRWCKKRLEEKHKIKIKWFKFPKEQLKIMFDMVTKSELLLNPDCNYLHIGKLKIKDLRNENNTLE